MGAKMNRARQRAQETQRRHNTIKIVETYNLRPNVKDNYIGILPRRL